MAGAKWDPHVRRWTVKTKTGNIPVKFSNWLNAAAPRAPSVESKQTPPEKKETTSSKATVPKEKVTKAAADATNGNKPKVVAKAACGIDWDNLPRVTDSLTIAQLSHEMLHRNSNVKGMFNKPKSWFLTQLGEDSISTTAPDVSIDFSSIPRVSRSMTNPQLVHELMSRKPSRRGLSGKSKDDLLKLAGVGSIPRVVWHRKGRQSQRRLSQQERRHLS